MALLVGALVASAQAATSTKFYSVTLSPSGPFEVGQSVPFQVTVNNLNTSTQTLGSANVRVPAGFTVPEGTGCLSASRTNWTACYVAPNIEFRAATSKDALLPNSSVSATIQLTASLPGDWTWVTAAKQSNSFSGPPGNAFAPSGPDPVTRVVGRLCKASESTPAGSTCTLVDGGTTAQTTVPATGAIEMTLTNLNSFNCNGTNVAVGSILLVNSSATGNYTVKLTYAGVTGQVDVCKSTNGVDFELLSSCTNTTPLDQACVLSNTGGPSGREILVRLAPGDPYVGGS